MIALLGRDEEEIFSAMEERFGGPYGGCWKRYWTW